MTAPALAVLALRFDCDVLPAPGRAARRRAFPGYGFPPLPLPRSGDPHADAAALMARSMRPWRLDRDRPEQWLWVHSSIPPSAGPGPVPATAAPIGNISFEQNAANYGHGFLGRDDGFSLAHGSSGVGSELARLYGPAMSTPFRFDPVALPPECEALRREVREFIADELAAGRWTPNSDFGSHRAADFSRRLGERGWIGMTWPKRYGGGERGFLERYTVTEELLAAGAPVGCHWIADRQSGPLCCATAATSSARHFCPASAAAKFSSAIGMSEPDTGSDLASIRTRAIPVCGGYEVTGAKVWTSYAHESHYAITLVRTDTRDPKNRHAGLSQLIVDLKAPGVTIRPIRNLAGEHDFNEIVLDRVFVPSERLVGREGDGWRRSPANSPSSAAARSGFCRRIRFWSALSSAPADDPDPALAEALGRIGANLWTLRQMSLSVAGMLQVGRNPEPRGRAGQGSRAAPTSAASPSGRARCAAAPRQVRRRPAGGGARRIRAARAVLDAARRHARDPARHHRPRPRAALRRPRRKTMRDTILYDSALRLFGDHVSPQMLAAAEAGTWPAALWRAVDEAGYLDVLAEGPAAWSRRSRSCAPPGIAPRRSRCPKQCWPAGCAPRAGSSAGRTLVHSAGGTEIGERPVGPHGAPRRRPWRSSRARRSRWLLAIGCASSRG